MNITCLSGNRLERFEGLSLSLVEPSPTSNSCLAAWPFTSFSQIAFVLEGGISLFLPEKGRMRIPPSHWFALSLARISHKFSAALRNDGIGADFPGFGTLQGVDPASPPNLHETPTSTRHPFARDEFCEVSGLDEWQANMKLSDGTKVVVIECPKAIWEFVVTDRDKLFHTQTACISCSQRSEAFFFQSRMQPRIRELSAKITKQDGASLSKMLHQQANVLELLALITESTSLKLPPESEPCLRSEDEAALNAAAAYLEENLSEDHSLARISRTVHLNEFKLKKGFREYYQTTVFGYLRQKRMERARSMLINRQAKVIDAAQAVGYANPSHFSRAFRKTFGMNPKEFIALNKRELQAAATEA